MLVHSLESPGELAAKRLAWELETRKSVELRTRTDITSTKADPQRPADFDAIEDHYVENAAGQRKCDSRHFKSDAAVGRYEHFSDGMRCADVNFSKNDLDKQESIIFKRQYWMEDRSERRECPQPLRFLYVGREPIHKALPSAAYLGEDRVLNRACHVFLFAQVRWEIPQDHVYYLDKATSVPLKLASYRDQTARDQKKPLWVWTAESLDKVQDHFVSLKSKMIQYAEDLQPGFTWTYSVISIQFDKDYPASMFSPAPQPGVTVLDSINSKRDQTPGARPAPPDKSTQAPRASEPILAVPPSDWTATISSFIFGLGATILAVGAILRWRHKSGHA